MPNNDNDNNNNNNDNNNNYNNNNNNNNNIIETLQGVIHMHSSSKHAVQYTMHFVIMKISSPNRKFKKTINFHTAYCFDWNIVHINFTCTVS